MWRWLTRRYSRERELERELNAHLELEEQEQIEAGVPAGEAGYAARRALGNLVVIREVVREAWGWGSVERLLQDVRYGLRRLAKNPGFTAVAASALALGIGVNTAIFSFADVILNRPVSLARLDRLVSIRERASDSGDYGPLAPADYLAMKAAARSFKQLAAYEYWGAGFGSRNGPEQIPGARVTADFFAAMSVTPARGRTFLPEEQAPGQHRVLVLSARFWQRRFASDTAILGRTMQLNGEPYTIVGVMPATFHFPLGGQQFWAPLPMGAAERNDHARRYVFPVGRLRHDASLEQARAEMEIVWRRLRAQYRTYDATRALAVQQLRDQVVGDDERQFALFLTGVVAFVLLIACANVANLQLARAAGRGREISVRTALGASRGRIVRQLVTESVVLSLLGGLLGVVFAIWAVPVLRTTLPSELSSICDVDSIRLNLRALLFTFAVACGAGVLSGLAPALTQSRTDLNEVLKESSGRATSRGGQRLRGAFVVVELALSLILLINAGLMVKGFVAVANQHANIQPESVLTFHVNLPDSRYPREQELRAFYADALERLTRLPRVQSAAVVTGLPYSFYDNSAKVALDGHAGQMPTAMVEAISSGYFRTLHIPLRGGREFDQRDRPDVLRVAIISQAMADRLWPAQTAVGRRFQLNSEGAVGTWVTIVGVVGDIRHEVYDRNFRSTVYVPYQQAPPRTMDFALRTAADPMTVVSTVRSAMLEIDRNQALEQVETMAEKITKQASALRFVAGLMMIFGAAALVLCAVGVYGLMAYSVAERRHEIGIRMALGARPAHLLHTVTRRGMKLTAVGLAVGIPSALGLAQLLSSLIYGVSPWDISIFAGAPLLLAAVAELACYIPARRAINIDPVNALHYE